MISFFTIVKTRLCIQIMSDKRNIECSNYSKKKKNPFYHLWNITKKKKNKDFLGTRHSNHSSLSNDFFFLDVQIILKCYLTIRDFRTFGT